MGRLCICVRPSVYPHKFTMSPSFEELIFCSFVPSVIIGYLFHVKHYTRDTKMQRQYLCMAGLLGLPNIFLTFPFGMWEKAPYKCCLKRKAVFCGSRVLAVERVLLLNLFSVIYKLLPWASYLTSISLRVLTFKGRHNNLPCSIIKTK